jgi:hypothetical protein
MQEQKSTSAEAKRLEEVKAKRAALAAKKSARDAARAFQDSVALEEQGLTDDEAIDRFETEIGPVGKKIMVVHTDLGAVILKRPIMAVYRRYQDKQSTKTQDMELMLVRPCVVYPEAEKLDRIFEELPATLITLASAVTTLAGFRQEEQSGK